MSLKKNSRDLILYVGIGIAVALAAVALPIIAPERYSVSHSQFSFFFFTLIFAIVLVRMYWPVRRLLKVWLLLMFLLGVHIAGYIILLNHVQQWPTFSYLFTMPVELMLIATIVKVCLNVLPPKVKL
jgi:hypothetical protein